MSSQGWSSGEVSEALVELARIALSDEDLAAAARHITDTAIDIFDAADFAGLSLVVGGEIQTAGATHRIAHQLDQIQYDTGEGPCIAAIRRSEEAEIADTSADHAWPNYSHMLAELGIGSVHAFPMRIGEEVTGALNLYSLRPTTMNAGQRADATLFAAQSAMVLRIMQVHQKGEVRRGELEEGLISRDVVGKAIGIVMQKEGSTSANAFLSLRSLSQTQNRKLRDVATDIVEEAEGRAAETERDTKATA